MKEDKFKSFDQFNTPQTASNFRHLLSCGAINILSTANQIFLSVELMFVNISKAIEPLHTVHTFINTIWYFVKLLIHAILTTGI